MQFRRVDQLEEKLDDLVSLLKPPDLYRGEQVLENGRNDGGSAMGAQSPFQPLLQQQQSETPSTAPSLSRSPGQAQLTSNNEGNMFPDALLYNYRHNMAPQFPFVIVPDRTSAAELSQRKPFLYKVLLMVSSYPDKKGQIKMVHEIFQYLSARMIIENETSFDLLQGLLVLMAWSVPSACIDSSMQNP